LDRSEVLIILGYNAKNMHKNNIMPTGNISPTNIDRLNAMK
jgi:hypothetical protein